MISPGETVKCHIAIAQGLRDLGVETLFGLIGDANLYMVDAFVRRCGGVYVGASNESGATLMAMGYAQTSGKVGAASITHGPALTNALTALVDAAKGSIPMVLLVGDTAVEEREHFQKVAQRELIVATGAGFEQVRTPATAVRDLAVAFRRAAQERRPIALNIPADFQWIDVLYEKQTPYQSAARPHVSQGVDLDNAIGIIASARRPLILAGRGAFEFDAETAIARLAKRLEAPLATTLKGKGLFADDPFNLGIHGTLSHQIALECIGQSDCVVAFGASLNQYTTAEGSLLKGKRLVEVNAVAEHLGRFTRPDAALGGDLEHTAETFIHWLDEAEIAGSGCRTDSLKQSLADRQTPDTVSSSRIPGTVDIRKALRTLDKAIPANRIHVSDGGRFIFESWPLFQVVGRRAFINTVNFASIGLGLSEAIGASRAAPDRTVLLVTGDGGFMLGGLVEFTTAVRCQADLIVIVCNDGGYGAEHIQFRRKQLDPSLSIIGWPDFAPIAEAMGGQGVTVRNDADLEAAAKAIISRDRKRPMLIDLKLDPDCIPCP